MRRAAWLLLVVTVLTVPFWKDPIATANTEQWQPISPEDLAMKDNPAQPGADAMILYREDFANEKFIDQDGSYVDEYYRIKIFTQKGVKWGDVEIPFYKEVSDIKDLSARTIRQDGSVINFEGKPFEKTIVKMSGVKFLAKTFTLPEVKPGCIVEYRYRRQFKPHYFAQAYWVLSEELFTREAHFSIYPYVSDSYGDNYPFFFRLFRVAKEDAPQHQPDGSYTMTARNIPGIEDEPLMPPRHELEARIEFFHRDQDAPQNETTDRYWTRNGKKWNDVLEKFINKKSALQNDLAQTVASGDSPDVKLQKIYARVQKIRNLNYEEYRSKEEMKQEKLKEESNVEDVLKNGYGSGRQINFLFVGLARAAGFQAAVVYVAPRDRNAFHPTSQDPSEIDDDITWVKTADKEYFLDPADLYCPFPLLPWNETATEGLRLSKQGGEVVQTPPPKPSDTTRVRSLDLQLDEDGNATGSVAIDYTGYIAAELRMENRKEDEAGRKKNFEDTLRGQLPAGATVEVTKISGWEDTSKPIHVEATIKAPAFATPTGHRLLIPSTLFQETMTKDFEAQKRSNDIYFDYPFVDTDTVTLHIPSDFTVESLPPGKNDNPGAVSYELTAAQQGNTVVIKRLLAQNIMIYDLKYYTALRAFFNSVKSNDNTEIVFHNGPAKGD